MGNYLKKETIMVKIKKRYICQECGYESPKWMGKCPGCDQWNTLIEEVYSNKTLQQNQSTVFVGSNSAVTLDQITNEDDERFSTGMEELNRVLGGGIVPGSLVLIGGDPGIGKSTIMLQISS